MAPTVSGAGSPQMDGGAGSPTTAMGPKELSSPVAHPGAGEAHCPRPSHRGVPHQLEGPYSCLSPFAHAPA